MSGKLTGDFDGFFWVENLDDQPHRIKMSPVIGEITPTHPLPPLDNPTFMVYEDGSLTFCLAAASTGI